MPLWGFLFSWSVVFSAPVILAIILGRHRINRTSGRTLLAISFACASAYMLWRVEWFDVWRHGTPPPSLLFIYGCYSTVYGLIGWFLARAILPRRVGANGSGDPRVVQ
jgi:hypothetical protein